MRGKRDKERGKEKQTESVRVCYRKKQKNK